MNSSQPRPPRVLPHARAKDAVGKFNIGAIALEANTGQAALLKEHPHGNPLPMWRLKECTKVH